MWKKSDLKKQSEKKIWKKIWLEKVIWKKSEKNVGVWRKALEKGLNLLAVFLEMLCRWKIRDEMQQPAWATPGKPTSNWSTQSIKQLQNPRAPIITITARWAPTNCKWSYN